MRNRNASCRSLNLELTFLKESAMNVKIKIALSKDKVHILIKIFGRRPLGLCILEEVRLTIGHASFGWTESIELLPYFKAMVG